MDEKASVYQMCSKSCMPLEWLEISCNVSSSMKMNQNFSNFEFQENEIMDGYADQKRSNFYVVFTMIFCGLNFRVW